MSEPIVAIVGRLTPWKGHAHFLDAAKKVVKKEQNVIFLIIGKPIAYQFGHIYKDHLETLASEMNISDQTIFTGHEDNMARVMNAIDILVSTSFEEPFGRVLIEAMACAKPVIATNSGGVPEIIDNEKNGVLVPYGDNNKLADKIIELIRDENKANSLGSEGRGKVEKNFDIRELVKSIEDIYMKVL
jgi:glycosyltransferase involved in cell wall biosynthesis